MGKTVPSSQGSDLGISHEGDIALDVVKMRLIVTDRDIGQISTAVVSNAGQILTDSDTVQIVTPVVKK